MIISKDAHDGRLYLLYISYNCFYLPIFHIFKKHRLFKPDFIQVIGISPGRNHLKYFPNQIHTKTKIMKKILILIALATCLTTSAQDSEKCKTSEPSYLTRMPGFYISDCKNSEYNEIKFVYDADGKTIVLNKGGKYYEIWYRKVQSETRKFSSAQVRANYSNAILKVNGKMLTGEGSSLPVFTASINGKEVYMQLHIGNSADMGSFWIQVVETDQMKQDITINLEEAIDRDGKAVLYGILFDVGKSDIKPESAEALKMINDYLNKNPSVKIIVVGHTDNTGSYTGNFTLSKARAESIKKYIIDIGKINADRIISEGVGSVCPVATNTTEDGRKLNRRVEIVKQ